MRKEEMIAERERMEKLIAELDQHPMTQKFREDKAAENLTRRRDIAQRIEELRKEEGAVLPKLEATLEEKEAVHAAAKAALEAAQEEVRAATFALRRARLDFDADIGECEASLLENPHPAISEAIAFFTGKLADLRRPGQITIVGRPSKLDIFSWRKIWTNETNAPAIISALAYCRDAIRELERMKLEPATDLESIKSLKDNFPDTEIYTEQKAEKPMEKVPMALVPRFGGASDDAYEQTLIDKLIKKTNDLLSKPATPRPAKKRAEPGERWIETRYTGARK